MEGPLARRPSPEARDVSVDDPARARDHGARPYVRLPAVALEDDALGTPIVHLAVGDLVMAGLVLDHPHLTTSSRQPASRLYAARGRTSTVAGVAAYRSPAGEL